MQWALQGALKFGTAGLTAGLSQYAAIIGRCCPMIKSPIIIGEGMSERVIPTAEEIGARWYTPKGPPEKWMEENRKWFNGEMDKGCKVFDCGLHQKN